MANNTVYIIDASTLIAVRNIASAANDPRFFNALLPPGQLVITTTVWREAAGKPNEYAGDKLLATWLTQQRESGRLVVKNTDYIPAGTRNAGDDSIRDIVPIYKDSKTDVFVITDDAGLAGNSGGADRVLSTNMHVVGNLVNGSITLTEYINTAFGLAAQGNTKNLFFPGQVYHGTNGVKIEMQAQGVLVTDSAGNKHFFTPNEKFKIDEQGNVRRSGDRSEAEYELLPVSEPTEGVLDGMPGLAEQFEKFIALDGQHYLVVPKDATLTHADGTVTLLTDFVNMVQEGTSALVGAIGSTLQSVPSYLAAIAPNVIADLAMGGDLEEVAERYAKIVGVTMGVDALGKLFGLSSGDPAAPGFLDTGAGAALKNGIIHFAVTAALRGSQMDGEDWGKLAANASMRAAVGYAVQTMGGSMSIAATTEIEKFLEAGFNAAGGATMVTPPGVAASHGALALKPQMQPAWRIAA